MSTIEWYSIQRTNISRQSVVSSSTLRDWLMKAFVLLSFHISFKSISKSFNIYSLLRVKHTSWTWEKDKCLNLSRTKKTPSMIHLCQEYHHQEISLVLFTFYKVVPRTSSTRSQSRQRSIFPYSSSAGQDSFKDCESTWTTVSKRRRKRQLHFLILTLGPGNASQLWDLVHTIGAPWRATYLVSRCNLIASIKLCSTACNTFETLRFI